MGTMFKNFILKAEFSDITSFYEVLHVINLLIYAVNFHFTPKGLTILSMDVYKICMVNVKIPCNGFKSFKCLKNITVGVNLNFLYQILKRLKSKNNVKFFLFENGFNMKISFNEKIDIQNNKLNTNSTTYIIKLIDIDCEDYEIDTFNHDAKCVLTSNLFQKYCNDLTLFGTSVKVSFEKST
jgi:proliferating cell nuclear antigen PCNA